MKNGVDKLTDLPKTIRKNQGSFFSKLIHTLKPDEYCVVDSYVRKVFNLENESYILSMLVISEAYKKFSMQNQLIMHDLKAAFNGWDIFKGKELTDLKLLDLVMWSLGEQKITSVRS